MRKVIWKYGQLLQGEWEVNQGWKSTSLILVLTKEIVVPENVQWKFRLVLIMLMSSLMRLLNNPDEPLQYWEFGVVDNDFSLFQLVC